MSAGDTLRRFERIVAIFIQLQSKRVVKAEELASRFQVSLRTIYRDIRVLEACGIPLMGEAGIGYSIMDGYRLPPIMFTREEAASFVAADRLMQTFTDKSLGAYHQAAIYKIKAVLSSKDKDWVDAIESQVLIDTSQNPFNQAIPDALHILFDSIADKRQVALGYLAFHSEELSQRVIEPIGVFHENHWWYVLGYCHLRNDYRQFRLDRIQQIERTKARFTRIHGSLEDYRESKDTEAKTVVVLQIESDKVKYIRRDFKHFGYVSETEADGYTFMTFHTTDTGGFLPRWLLMYGDFVQIVEPESLKDEVRKLIGEVTGNLLR